MSEADVPPAGGDRARVWRSRAIGALKLMVSIGLVAGILWKVPIGNAVGGIRALSVPAAAWIIILTLLFPVLAAFRWKRALARLGSHQSWTSLLGDTLVSSTYNMLLPTQVGGDVVRSLRCGKRLSQPHHAWSSMIFERLMGIVALAMLAVPGVVMGSGRTREIGIAVGAVAVGSFVLVVAAPAPLRWAARILASRAPSVSGAGERIAADLSGPLSSLWARAEMMVWSVAYQFVGLGILMVVVVDWGMPEMVPAILGAVPLALVLTLVPVSIAGLGVRESLFVVLLGRFGLASERALSLAVVWLASALIVAMAGAVVMGWEAARGVRGDPVRG